MVHRLSSRIHRLAFSICRHYFIILIFGEHRLVLHLFVSSSLALNMITKEFAKILLIKTIALQQSNLLLKMLANMRRTQIQKSSSSVQSFETNVQFFNSNKQFFNSNMQYFSSSMQYFSSSMQYFSSSIEFNNQNQHSSIQTQNNPLN